MHATDRVGRSVSNLNVAYAQVVHTLSCLYIEWREAKYAESFDDQLGVDAENVREHIKFTSHSVVSKHMRTNIENSERIGSRFTSDRPRFCGVIPRCAFMGMPIDCSLQRTHALRCTVLCSFLELIARP